MPSSARTALTAPKLDGWMIASILVIVVAGSIFLLGDVLKLRGRHGPEGEHDDRAAFQGANPRACLRILT